MNPDFQFVLGSTQVKTKEGLKPEATLLLTYKNVGLAKWQNADAATLVPQAEKYVKNYGYLAEWSRLWKLKDASDGWISWTDSMYVDIEMEN